MEPISIVCAVFLFFSCHLQGSSALTHVFVQKGKDVLLELMKADVPKTFIVFQWRFNKSIALVSFSPGGELTVSDAYTRRVESIGKNYSVKLKNLQDSDSGVYTARVIKTQGEQILAEYNVTVQDPVAPVELTVNSVSNSSDSCNLTVTCSTQDSHHINSTLTCDTKTCSQEGGERSKVTTSDASLLVYLVNDSIICNHSNQVSWTNDSKMIGEFCPRHAGQRTERYHVHPLVIVAVVAVIIIIAAVIVYHRKKKKKRKYETEKIENTVYAVPEVESPARPLDQSQADETSGPTSTYCLVGPHSEATGSSETRGNTLPDSLYSTVGKSSRA